MSLSNIAWLTDWVDLEKLTTDQPLPSADLLAPKWTKHYFCKDEYMSQKCLNRMEVLTPSKIVLTTHNLTKNLGSQRSMVKIWWDEHLSRLKDLHVVHHELTCQERPCEEEAAGREHRTAALEEASWGVHAKEPKEPFGRGKDLLGPTGLVSAVSVELVELFEPAEHLAVDPKQTRMTRTRNTL